MKLRLLHQAKITAETKTRLREFAHISGSPISQITELALSQYLDQDKQRQLLVDHYQQRWNHLHTKGGDR